MQIGFFNEEHRLEKLTKLGDSLVCLYTTIILRGILTTFGKINGAKRQKTKWSPSI